MKNLFLVLKFIFTHPLNVNNRAGALLRFIKWQILSRLTSNLVVFPFTDRSLILVKRGLTGATGNIYCGLHEFNDMGFLLHFLRQEDCFVDVGANIGSYSILAGVHVGANTISLEPLPSTFKLLKQNIAINQIDDNVRLYNIALGDLTGEIKFTTNLDTMNHIVVDESEEHIIVPIDTLDNLLMDNAIPILVKVDVEGYEKDVLNGSSSLLSNPILKAIILELNGSSEKYGYLETEIHEKLLSLDFNPYMYNPFERKLYRAESFGTHNTIYLRDLLFVEQRLKSADKVVINGNVF